jgi:hypothetical protein
MTTVIQYLTWRGAVRMIVDDPRESVEKRRVRVEKTGENESPHERLRTRLRSRDYSLKSITVRLGVQNPM